jgi:hypothetical protein
LKASLNLLHLLAGTLNLMGMLLLHLPLTVCLLRLTLSTRIGILLSLHQHLMLGLQFKNLFGECGN